MDILSNFLFFLDSTEELNSFHFLQTKEYVTGSEKTSNFKIIINTR